MYVNFIVHMGLWVHSVGPAEVSTSNPKATNLIFFQIPINNCVTQNIISLQFKILSTIFSIKYVDTYRTILFLGSCRYHGNI